MSDTANIRIAAYGLVLREEPGRQLLLCRISARVPGHAGQWTLPGGGLDFGEDPAVAMVREVREETGLIVRPNGVAGIDSLVAPEGGSSLHSLRIVYYTEVLGGELCNEVDGSTDLCAWHDMESARSLPVVGLVERGLSFVLDRGQGRRP